ncbi:MAG: PLP-dependent aminotransferase family protein [Hyphomicrobiaceae bacterium]
MTGENFDLAAQVRSDLPPGAVPWTGFAEFNFVGGHNAPEMIPVDDLISAATTVLNREGRTLATYRLESGPLGYLSLREFLASKLNRLAGIECTPDEILITTGSSQGINLVNDAMLSDGDTVIIEEACYAGCLSRFQALGVTPIGIPGDGDGMDMDVLAANLDELAARGIKPKYIYTIPTVQNPTSSIMSVDRRRRLLELAETHGIPIFEDECYSDLIWDGDRPPAIHALDQTARTIYVGTFSKSIAPALRVGYVVAPWQFLSRLLPLKIDAGSGALEQMVLAEYCSRHFDAHVSGLNKVLKAKCDALIDALGEHFGTTAEFVPPKGGIYLWVKLPAAVDTTRLAQIAAKEGVAINPGAEWSIEGDDARRALRICFANPPIETIRGGIAKLAEICNREFGVPTHIANVERG